MLHHKSIAPALPSGSRFSRLFDLFEQGLPQDGHAKAAPLSAQKARRLLTLAGASFKDRPVSERSAPETCSNDEFFRRIRSAGRRFDMRDFGEPLL